MATRTLAIIVFAAALAACAGTGNADTATPAGSMYRELGITLPDLDDADFEIVSKTKNDVHVLAFWAVWCQPCQAELAELQIIWKDMRDRGLNVYAVSIDGPETQTRVAGLANSEGYEFPVLLDRETEVLSSFNPKGDIPFYVVLDADGQVIKSHQGYVKGDMEGLRAFLEEKLPASSG
jgi:peroxiredoxin